MFIYGDYFDTLTFEWRYGKRGFGHMRTAQARSDCASAQSDQGLHCPLAESLVAVECIYLYQLKVQISNCVAS